MKTITRYLVSELLLSLGFSGAAVAKPAGEREAALDKLVAGHGITADDPGIAVLVRDGQQVLLQKGYGLAKLKDRTPITPKTHFELASVSKTMTATAVLLLVDRGKFGLDDDIRRYIPELPDYKKGTVTIRSLLNHTSGLPDYMDLEDIPMKNGSYITNDDVLAALAAQVKDHPAPAAVGAKYEYNNTNYFLLATLIERVEKKPFGVFMRDEIFKPLGMDRTFVNQTPTSYKEVPDEARGAAIGYDRDQKSGKKSKKSDKKKKKNDAASRPNWTPAWGLAPDRTETNFVVGDGSVWSTLEDMAKWDDAVRARKVLKAETWKAALTASKTKDGETNDYGLGWSLYGNEGGKLNGFGHEGSWIFQTTYYLHLGSGRTTIVLSNRDDFDPDAFWYDLEELFD